MANFATPSKCNKAVSDTVRIPPSPFLQKLGYGTGVSVYKFQRSPVCNQEQSPWAVKRTMQSKSSNKEINKRLLEEASILKKLDHPNIVGFRAFVKDTEGKNCLVMEECTTSLGNLIEDRHEQELNAFPANVILKVALHIAKAMHYLHNEKYILHCDIKSYNILVKGDFEICKLCDFGVTLPLSNDGVCYKNEDEDSFSNEYLGTLCWTAPEVLNEQIISTKADIYSYGLVLWEMLALVPPPEPDFCEENYMYITKRPELPCQEFTDDYNYVLELFYCCTKQKHEKRPKASDLVVIIQSMIQYKNDN